MEVEGVVFEAPHYLKLVDLRELFLCQQCLSECRNVNVLCVVLLLHKLDYFINY